MNDRDLDSREDHTLVLLRVEEAARRLQIGRTSATATSAAESWSPYPSADSVGSPSTPSSNSPPSFAVPTGRPPKGNTMEEQKKRMRRANGESAIYFGKDERWHARVPMGYKDDGTPYRRHLTRPTRKELVDEVRRLEKQRDEGSARQPGKPWTVEKWLLHWIENIAKPVVSENTYDGYEVAVRVHLVPGVGKHRIDRLEPEHLESLYRRMQKAGSKAGTAHQAHRTARTALGEAVRRGHASKNAAALAKPPRMEEDETEVEPYSVEEVQRLLLEVNKRRNSARWMLALALGLRQGETLGLRWEDVDLDNEYLKLRRNRLRPKYAHGCSDSAPVGGRRATAGSGADPA